VAALWRLINRFLSLASGQPRLHPPNNSPFVLRAWRLNATQAAEPYLSEKLTFSRGRCFACRSVLVLQAPIRIGRPTINSAARSSPKATLLRNSSDETCFPVSVEL
jgi:hypothetical protein